MSASRALFVAAEEARLYEDLARLMEAFWADVRGGDESRLEEFAGRRERIVDALDALGPIPDLPSVGRDLLDNYWERSATAIRRIQDLDREIVKVLEAQKAAVREELGQLARGRELHEAYQGAAPTSPVFLDRVG